MRAGDAVFFGSKDAPERVEFESFTDSLSIFLDGGKRLKRRERTELAWAELSLGDMDSVPFSPHAREEWWQVALKLFDRTAAHDEAWLREKVGQFTLPDWCLPIYSPCSGQFRAPAAPIQSAAELWGGLSARYWLGHTYPSPLFTNVWVTRAVEDALRESDMTHDEFAAAGMSLAAAGIVVRALESLSKNFDADASAATFGIQVQGLEDLASDLQPTEFWGDDLAGPDVTRSAARAQYLAAMSMKKMAVHPGMHSTPSACAIKLLNHMGVPMLVQGQRPNGATEFFLWIVPEAWFLRAIGYANQGGAGFERCFAVSNSSQGSGLDLMAGWCNSQDAKEIPPHLRGLKAYRGFSDASVYGMEEHPMQFLLGKSPGVWGADVMEASQPEATLHIIAQESMQEKANVDIEFQSVLSFERPLFL